MIKINLEIDNNKKENLNLESNISIIDIINKIDNSLLKETVAVRVNNILKDLSTIISEDSTIELIKFDSDIGKEICWHSSAHILALAVKRLFKDAKLGIGPSIEQGFYYDFDLEKPFSEEDLKNIENETKKILKEKIKFERFEVDYSKAKELLSNQPYKLELLKDLKEKNEKISIYKLDDWYELCRGPHVKDTGKIKFIKLLKTSGAYWKGDNNNKQLQRIYGISFLNKEEFKEYVFRMEEAQKRDHRKIGQELDLFSFHEEASGMPFFHNNGTFIWNTLVNYITDELYNRGYEINKTPVILNKNLWLKSGHWNHYKDNMYFTNIDSQEYALKPMNCPGNLLIYKSHFYSYKDLPIRAGEFGLVHRHELSGTLSGLFRVRAFTQDDAHIFCTQDQIKDEIKGLLSFIEDVYSVFGFDYHLELSTRPEKSMGDPKLWDLAENILKEVLEQINKGYEINEGDGAFYGPKIDIHLKDSIGRTWQCGTIQLDFQMPEKFDLTYEDKDNSKKRPVMLHRVILGSVERFMGILIEHFAGKFPLWISPVQLIILPISDIHLDYAKEVYLKLKKENFRVEIDDKSQTMNKKVRNAQLRKINYIIVIGDQEKENKTINIRTRENKILGEIKIDDFIKDLKIEIENKEIK
jgi:threonyl-tRNA synthetase